MGRGLATETKDLLQKILDVFAAEHPNSPRRVAYAIFGNQAGRNASKISKLCGRLLDEGRLPLDWYDDSSRAYVNPYVTEDLDSLVTLNRGVPPFDPWRSQPVRCVVWSEKAVGGTLQPVLDAYSTPFLNTSGWNSRKMLMEEARRTRQDARRLVILYVGDHDAAGLRMSVADLPARLTKYQAERFEIRRIAITSGDFAAYRAQGLADPAKPDDKNLDWYRAQTGAGVGVELEAMPAPDLRSRVEAAINACIVDVPAWNQTMHTSRAVAESWAAYCDRWPRPAIQTPVSKYEGGHRG